jgi:hypothetical protein
MPDDGGNQMTSDSDDVRELMSRWAQANVLDAAQCRSRFTPGPPGAAAMGR